MTRVRKFGAARGHGFYVLAHLRVEGVPLSSIGFELFDNFQIGDVNWSSQPGICILAIFWLSVFACCCDDRGPDLERDTRFCPVDTTGGKGADAFSLPSSR